MNPDSLSGEKSRSDALGGLGRLVCLPRWTFVMMVVGLLALLAMSQSLSSPADGRTPAVLPLAEVEIGQDRILAEVADEDRSRALGLSGRQSLGKGQGMVFLFESPGTYGFWMKGMVFALDFVWIADGRVVGITPSVEPPAAGETLQLIYPPAPVTAVLEVPAGYAAERGWREGAPVSVAPLQAVDGIGELR